MSATQKADAVERLQQWIRELLGLRLAFFADPWGNLFEVIQLISQ